MCGSKKLILTEASSTVHFSSYLFPFNPKSQIEGNHKYYYLLISEAKYIKNCTWYSLSFKSATTTIIIVAKTSHPDIIGHEKRQLKFCMVCPTMYQFLKLANLSMNRDLLMNMKAAPLVLFQFNKDRFSLSL